MARQAKGFEEERQANLVPEAAVDIGVPVHHGRSVGFSDGALQAKLKIGPGGRVVIPAEIREALGVAEGDVLLSTCENGELRIMTAATAVSRARALVRKSIPAGHSLVDELIAERRAENARDSQE